MIKTLQKKICFLFVLLLSIIWLGILLVYENNVYRNNLMDVKEDVRYMISDTKWKTFLKNKGTTSDFEGIDYCVYELDDAFQPHILFSTFTNKSDADLLRDGQRLASNWKGHKRFLRYAYIYKYKFKQCC